MTKIILMPLNCNVIYCCFYNQSSYFYDYKSQRHQDTSFTKKYFNRHSKENYNLNGAITVLSQVTSRCYLCTAHNCKYNNWKSEHTAICVRIFLLL